MNGFQQRPWFIRKKCVLEKGRAWELETACGKDIWKCRGGRVYSGVVSGSQNGNPG